MTVLACVGELSAPGAGTAALDPVTCDFFTTCDPRAAALAQVFKDSIERDDPSRSADHAQMQSD